MAEELDDGEYWLPAEFLTDDDLLTDFRTQREAGISHGFGGCFGFGSNLSSPVESLIGSGGNESDEDDFVSGLTWDMGKASLNLKSHSFTAKMYGSPQSTLCGCETGSKSAWHNCLAHAASPSPSPLEVEAKAAMARDFLYAEEVARMRMVDETASFHSLKPPQKPSLEPTPFSSVSQLPPFYPFKSQDEARLAYLRLISSQFQRMKQRMTINGVPRHESADFQFQIGDRTGTRSRGVDSWPTLQQSCHQRRPNHPFPVNGVKKERNGTGVFLPRRLGSGATETTHKKQALRSDKSTTPPI